jgi:hypothetical protein
MSASAGKRSFAQRQHPPAMSNQPYPAAPVPYGSTYPLPHLAPLPQALAHSGPAAYQAAAAAAQQAIGAGAGEALVQQPSTLPMDLVGRTVEVFKFAAKHRLPSDCTAVLLEAVIDSGAHGAVYRGRVINTSTCGSSSNVNSSNQGSGSAGASVPGEAGHHYCCASAAAAAAAGPQLEVAVKVAPGISNSLKSEWKALQATTGNPYFTQLFAVGGVARNATSAAVAAVAAQAAASRHASQTGGSAEMNDKHTLPCLIMELCEGTLESTAMHAEQQTLQEMQSVLQGLDMLHKGVGSDGFACIHRWAQPMQQYCMFYVCLKFKPATAQCAR